MNEYDRQEEEEEKEKTEQENIKSQVEDALTDAGKRLVSKAFKNTQTATKKAVKRGLTKLGASMAPLLAKIGLAVVGTAAAVVAALAWLFALLITILLWTAGFIVFVAFILFIINSGAYMVPPGEVSERGTSTLPPSGGIVVACPPESSQITSTLASRIGMGAISNLLPIGTGPRGNGLCIIPTMIVMHWSAGYDNAQGNSATFSTLQSRDLACQVATDTNDVYLMQPFYENSVEYPWCANSWNIYSINNEMAGGCAGSCNFALSECDPRNSLAFDSEPPHPCMPETDRAIEATCVLMEQYNIPWCQIYGHYQVPDSGGKIDPGEEFLQDYFIPRIRQECPNDTFNTCGGGSGIDPLCQASIQEISPQIRSRIENNSWKPGCPVAIEDLRYLRVSYWGYDNQRHDNGELIVNSQDAAAIASTMRNLCTNHFPINKMVLIDSYYSQGMAESDRLSMEDNNTSAFNCRCLAGETPPCDYTETPHSYGRAIDINPRQNPYISDGNTLPSGATYNPSATGTITSSGTVVNTFRNINWYWGGFWTNPRDYMHFSYNNN